MKTIFVALTFLFAIGTAIAEDDRTPVDFPLPMQAHMLANMRDHLAALAEANTLAAAGHWDEAADVVEHRIGMSSLDAHGASHMAPLMPQGMRELGTAMHRSASRLARVLQEAEPQPALEAIGELMSRCHACHSSYRLR
ncbi:MAG: cytochrome c [Gammaproteobacteria bacterium]|nr:cytochrome c [Gammaproteobacteria bacterium]